MKNVWQQQRWWWCDGQWGWAYWNIEEMRRIWRKQRWTDSDGHERKKVGMVRARWKKRWKRAVVDMKMEWKTEVVMERHCQKGHESREEWATDRERWRCICNPLPAQGDGGERWELTLKKIWTIDLFLFGSPLFLNAKIKTISRDTRQIPATLHHTVRQQRKEGDLFKEPTCVWRGTRSSWASTPSWSGSGRTRRWPRDTVRPSRRGLHEPWPGPLERGRSGSGWVLPLHSCRTGTRRDYGPR